MSSGKINKHVQTGKKAGSISFKSIDVYERDVGIKWCNMSMRLFQGCFVTSSIADAAQDPHVKQMDVEPNLSPAHRASIFLTSSLRALTTSWYGNLGLTLEDSS